MSEDRQELRGRTEALCALRSRVAELETVNAEHAKANDELRDEVRRREAAEDEREHAAGELRESQRRYQNLFTKMLDGFALHEILCDESGKPIDYRFLAVNPAFERLTGLKAADLIGRTVLEVLPDIESSWIEAYGKVALTGEPTHFENYAQELDRHFEVTAYRPSEGQFACIFVDVTDRKRAEEELREQTRLAQTLLDAMPCVALLLRPSTREIVAANKAGLEAGCIIGQTCYGTWVKSESPCSFCLAPDVWKDGKAKHLEVEALGVVWDANWVPISDDLYLHYAFDITERRRAERATAQSEAKFRALFERTPDSVLLVDPETGAILEFNRRAHEVLGYTREEFEHLQVADFEAKESSNEVAAHTRRIGARGDDCFETQHRTKDGRVLDVLVNSGTVFVAGRKCIVSTLTDITEKHRLLADARQEARIRQNLLRELNHRVKNNLATIAGFLQLEKGRPERDKGAFIQALQGRLSSLSELHVLLGEHLAGEVDVEKLVQRVVNTTVWNLEGTAPTTTVTVRADGAHLDTDRAGAIAMLISELVSNAVRHGLRGLENPQLQVELTHDQDGWRLCVSDNGRGFEDGFDLAGNAGSGLQIVQFIVEKQLRGTLELTRDADRTTVTIHCSHLTSNPDAG